jgi:preprotein translocase subunit SecE
MQRRPFLSAICQAALSLSVMKESNVAGKDDKKNKRENAIQRFFRETMGELRKVHWPTWPEARRLTIIVIVVLIFMAIFLGLVDWAANQVLILAIGA